MTTIGFIKSSNSSFIVKDIELLQQEYEVDVCTTHISIKNIKNTIESIINIFRCVNNNDVNYTWFTSHHALVSTIISKILRKKSIVVIGGYEVEDLKEIDYGAMNKPLSSFIVKSILKLADRVITVSDYSRNKTLQYTNSNKVEMIYNCVPSHKINKNIYKESVVTVGNATKSKYQLKGLELFAKASRMIPSRHFIIIGPFDKETKDYLHTISPNLIFTGQLSHNEVLNHLESTKVYCQFSKVESFGMSLIESISCDCIPVILDNGAMSEVSKPLSIITDNININKDLQKALNTKVNTNTRDRILNKFSCNRRLNKLIKLIDGVVK